MTGIKKFFVFISIIAILLIPALAFAEIYAGNHFMIDIPKTGNVYYYTPTDTNMQGELLEKVKGESGLFVLNGVYDDQGYLAYSLKVLEKPLQNGEDVAAAQNSYLEELKQQAGADYMLGDASQETFNGIDGLVSQGDHKSDASFASKVYAFSDEKAVYGVVVIYKKTEDNKAFEQAMQQLDTFVLNSATQETTPVSTSSTVFPVQTAEAQNETALQATPERETQSATVTIQPEQELIQKMPEVSVNEPTAGSVLFITVLCGGIAVAAVVAVFFVSRLRKGKSWKNLCVKKKCKIADSVPNMKERRLAVKETENQAIEPEEEIEIALVDRLEQTGQYKAALQRIRDLLNANRDYTQQECEEFQKIIDRCSEAIRKQKDIKNE